MHFRQKILTGDLAWLADGTMMGLACLVLLVLILRKDLREAPAWVGPALIATCFLGLVLRMAISRDAIMTAWPYSRMVPLASAIAHGPVFKAIASFSGTPIYITDLIFNTNFALAVLTPLAVFTHANALFKDSRVALAVAGLLAVYPAHIMFSRSDVLFIQSIALSSLTFAILYRSLRAETRGWLVTYGLALVPLLIGTYGLRPLNAIYFPLCVATVFVTVGPAVSMGRRWLVAAIVTGTFGVNVVTNLMAQSHQVSEGLGINTFTNALRIAGSLRLNTLINPSVTPILYMVLALAGGRWLLRKRQHAMFLYLSFWLGSFFVAHAYIWPHSLTMQARYHLHLAVPFLLFAGAGVNYLFTTPNWARVLVVLVALASPLTHLEFERDLDFGMQQEFEFLTSLREEVPLGCNIVEFRGSSMVDLPRSSRLARVGHHFRDGRWVHSWRILSVAAPWEEAGRREYPGDFKVFTLKKAMEKVMDSGRCSYFFEGNLCWYHAVDPTLGGPPCEEIRSSLEMEEVLGKRFINRTYDPSDELSGVNYPGDWRERNEEIALKLYRIKVQDPAKTTGPDTAP